MENAMAVICDKSEKLADLHFSYCFSSASFSFLSFSHVGSHQEKFPLFICLSSAYLATKRWTDAEHTPVASWQINMDFTQTFPESNYSTYMEW